MAALDHLSIDFGPCSDICNYRLKDLKTVESGATIKDQHSYVETLERHADVPLGL